MANYTITRHTESGHAYGCTNFSTIQVAGQVASHASNAPLDGTVVWRIKADLGYSVHIDDFLFVGATSVLSSNPNITTSWINLPNPILGASITKIQSTILEVVLYLAPHAGAVGGAFVMPNADVSTIVNIEGCARFAEQPVHVHVNKQMNSRTTTQVVVNPKLSSNIVSNVLSATSESFHGTLPAKKVDDDSGEQYISSYSVSAEKGYRYSSTPTLNFDTKAYRVDRFVTKTDNEFDPKKQDVTGVRFDIYKK